MGFWSELIYTDLHAKTSKYSTDYLAPLHRAGQLYYQDLQTLRTIQPFLAPFGELYESSKKLETQLVTYFNTVVGSSDYAAETQTLALMNIQKTILNEQREIKKRLEEKK